MAQSNSSSNGSRSVEQTNQGNTQYITNIFHAKSEDASKSEDISMSGDSTKSEDLPRIFLATGMLLLIGSAFTLAYPPFSIALAASGLLLLIVHLFHIQLSPATRNIVLIALVLLNLPLGIAFGKERFRLSEAERNEMLQEQQARLDEGQRKDSLNTCLLRIDTLYQKGEADKALVVLDKADLLAETPGEQADVDQVRIAVSLMKTTELMKRHQYNMAVDLLSSLHELDTNDTDVLYMRARCYVETNHIANAVHDVKKAMSLGHKDAGKLYEEINPLRKQVAYTCTLCRDGTYSNAKGSGACSHHKGVKEWNHRVYEMGRQYK